MSDRRADDRGQSGDRADPECGADRQRRRDRRDQRLRQREADRSRHRVDVRGRARDQVAGAGALDRRERQCEHAAHEVLTELCEHLLGENDTMLAARRTSQPSAQRETPRARARGRRCGRASCRSGPTARGCRESAGPARPVAPATTCRTTTRARPGRWRPASVFACARSSGPDAIGRSVLIRPPRRG